MRGPDKLRITVARHLIKLVVVLLIAAAITLLAQAYKTASQERVYHQAALSRSVDSTARELALHIDGIHRALRLFANQERRHLAKLVAAPGWISPDDRIREQVRRYFPNHLAFAIADPLAESVLTSNAELFGSHCRYSLDTFSNDLTALPPAPSIHSSGPDAIQHFDVLTPIPNPGGNNDDIGIMFVSFPVGDLLRLLANGMQTGHRLVLLEAHPTQLDRETALIGHHPVGNREVSRVGLPGTAIAPPDGYRATVTGTPWHLVGWADAKLTTQAGRSGWTQALVGCVALLLAGSLVGWAVTQEKLSRINTNIIIDQVEVERKRIARDLHDQVLADVSHVRRLLAELEISGNKNAALLTEPSLDCSHSVLPMEQLQPIISGVSLFADSIRATIEDLHPHTLDILGLCHSIEAYVEKRCRNGPTTRICLDPKVDSILHAEQKVQLFRIMAELVNNALQHSKCQQLRIDRKRCIKHSIAITHGL